MHPPLALLGRPSGAVLIQQSGTAAPMVAGFTSPQLIFSGGQDAQAFLSQWLGDGAAMGRLRDLLQQLGHPRVVAKLTDREVLAALAGRLSGGGLAVWEQDSERTYLNVRAAFSAAAAKSRAASAPDPAAVVVPEPPPAPPAVPADTLLPLVQEVQIEGAQVLPEILQTLDQIDATMGEVDLASASLEPTPAAVPPVTDAMKEASEEVTKGLDDL